MSQLLTARLGKLGEAALALAQEPAKLRALLDGFDPIAPAGRAVSVVRAGSMLMSGRAVGLIDPRDPATLILLLRLITVVMPELLQDWLAMTVSQFVRSAVGRFLLATLGDAETSNLFFVGHVAMVIRCDGGEVVAADSAQGEPFVIEANTTDYSHYRVALHPYQDPATADLTAPAQRIGWVDRRLALGERVWMARVRLPVGSEDAFRRSLAECAQSLLGRPYGFFDHPGLGDIDRLYCSEYVLQSFIMAAAAQAVTVPDLLDCCRWGWMARYLEVTNQQRPLKLVHDLMAERRFPADRRFFVLSPPMLWNSAAVRYRWSPAGEPGYTPDVPPLSASAPP